MTEPSPYLHHRSLKQEGRHFKGRISILIIISSFIFLVIIGRLFQLQILRHDNYNQAAADQHFGTVELPARRGEILAKTASGELSKLATNTTLDLVYVDPLISVEKAKIAEELAPLLFAEEDYDLCIANPKECPYSIQTADTQKTEEPLLEPSIWQLDQTKNQEEPMLPEDEPEKQGGDGNKTYSQMLAEAQQSILEKISQEEVDYVVLKRDVDEAIIEAVENAGLQGIFVDKDHFMVYGDPTLIAEKQLKGLAKNLSEILKIPSQELENELTRRKVRYVFLKNKISPDISRKIRDLELKGVVLLPEHWRFYPEGNLAAHLIGFINRENAGQYGVEGYFNGDLEGKKGRIYAESDPFGRQVMLKEGEIINPIDGNDVILTINPVVQGKVEEILEKKVKSYRADSAQAIVMRPFTGEIVAMANYPTFDPNAFGDAYTLKKADPAEEILATTPLFKKDDKNRYVPIKKEEREDSSIQKYIYANRFGPGVFKNKTISEYYEPGSIFKPIVMSIALDAKEVTPETTFNDDGPKKIDEFTIRNSTHQYWGPNVSMLEVLQKSLNTGMVFVVQRIGRQLLYDYLDKFGLNDPTNIQLDGETSRAMDYYKDWPKAQLLTMSFGQGIVATPLQLITAWAALANGGKLVEPYITDSVISEEGIKRTEPKVLETVISPATAATITSMLTRVAQGSSADIPGYAVAGKTGTAQIAGPGGKYESGEGSTITSYVGYFPALKPEFVILVKFDRARAGNVWGENTAAPAFHEIAQFLIEHYSLQPN